MIFLRKFFNILKKVLLVLLLLLVLLYGLLHLSSVQTWVVKKIAGRLSEQLDTRVTIQSVDLEFFNNLVLKGLMVEDRSKDTLLYAGTTKANLTDWFFLKDKITVNNIELEDANINMRRTDSIWNYQFLVDFFSTPKNNKKKKKGVEIDVKEIHLKNVVFNKFDKWVGQGMTASIKKLDVLIDKVDIPGKQVIIREIYLEKPVFAQSDFEGLKPVENDLTDIMAKIPVVSAFKWNNSGWVAKIQKIQIVNGAFQNDKLTDRAAYTDRFDGQHVHFSNINGSATDVLFLNDTLQVNISLKAKEKNGLDIKKFESHLRFTPELMEFNRLDLQTNKSKLGDYYAMRYSTFNKDMSSFIHNINLEAHFKESVLSTDDLAIFAPDLSDMKRVFFLEGNAKGTIDNFNVRAMKIRTGNTFLDGDLSMRGLPDINNTFIDLRARTFKTTYNDLAGIVPSLRKVKTPALYKLGAIEYEGSYTGFIKDFVAYGKIRTNLGTVVADLNMKIGNNGQAAYSGKINTGGFELGAFLNNKNLGTIAVNGVIKGQNFAVKDLKANFKGKVQKLDYAGYTYQNIIINGDFEKQIFRGKASIDDPNLKIANLEGEISLSGKELAFNADADVTFADLQKIGLSKDKITFSGVFGLNFTGNSIDNFLGTATVKDASLQHEDQLLSFDSLTLRSFIENDKKTLSLKSNELDATISGQFKIMQLPNAFKVFLARYYPTYFPVPKDRVDNQDFSFNIKTYNIDEYIRLFDNRLAGFNNASIDGSLALNNYRLNVNAFVPYFSYDGKVFTNTDLKANGNQDTLFAKLDVEDIALNDSLHFPETTLQLAAHNDLSRINLKTSSGNILNDADLNASIETLNDGVRVHFFPSTFILNGKQWRLEEDGEISIRKNYIDANKVQFVNNDQEIVISSELDDVTDDIHLVASLKNVIIQDFLPFWLPNPSLKGKLTGEVKLKDYFDKQNISFIGIADSLTLNDSYIGRTNLESHINTSTGKIDYKISTKGTDNAFNIDGYYNYKDSIGDRMNTRLLAERINMNILEPYLGTVFSKINGFGKANLVIKGAQNMTIVGDVDVDTAALTVAFTQCKYIFNNQRIHFGENLIDFGQLKIRDTLNNTGVVAGKLYHKFFKEFEFENIRVETSKMLLLNTRKKDNAQFYGNVIGNALMTINGSITNLQMNIDGQPSIFDSSHIYLNTGETGRESGSVDYINFIQFGSEMDKPLGTNKAANITVNMNITANPACKVDVILDEETGDVIKGQGNGKLNIRVGTTEALSIRGRYEITQGEYTFNFQTLLKKPFILSRGSITWNGDPYLAQIDIDARYVAERVDISSITSSSNVRSREDIIILSKLTGSLTKPEITFEFLLPENSEWNRDYFTVKKLADFQNDKNEMYKQVASLLLVNTFITGNQSFLNGGNTYNLAASSIGGVVSDFLTKVFNKELERATKGVVSTYIDINPSVDLQSTARQLQANVRAGLKIFLSNRIKFLVGGNLDYNNPYLQTSGLLTPDINIEWLLNKDGSIKVVGFSKTSTDLTSNQRNRSGVKLSYRKDFNKLSDIFKSRKKIQAEN